MAKLIGDLFGVRAGQVYPETIPAGEECPPELLAAARDLGLLGLKVGKRAAAAPETSSDTPPEGRADAAPEGPADPAGA